MFLREVFKTPLQYTAAIRMCRKFVNVSTERVDEFQTIGRNPLYQLLNDLQVKQERIEVELE